MGRWHSGVPDMAVAGSLVVTFPLRLIAGLLTFTLRPCRDHLRRAVRQSPSAARHVNDTSDPTVGRFVNCRITTVFAKR
jgi:hypothetical protein